MWDKATTDDDWSDQGEPHQWWDRYSEPPMCAFPRFDIAEMAYVLPMMLEATPALAGGLHPHPRRARPALRDLLGRHRLEHPDRP